MSDDTTDHEKAAPSLADDFSLLAQAATPGPWHISPLCAIDMGGAKFASLSDAVQNEMLEHPEGWLCETVQTHGAIHEFDANRADVDSFVFISNNRDRILAALRAVEAVRAFPTRPAICPWGQCVSDSRPCVECDIYGDGVEAVQSLLEGGGVPDLVAEVRRLRETIARVDDAAVHPDDVDAGEWAEGWKSAVMHVRAALTSEGEQ